MLIKVCLEVVHEHVHGNTYTISINGGHTEKNETEYMKVGLMKKD